MAAVHKSVVVFALLFVVAQCWIPRFLNGRPKGGLLGVPKLTRPVKLPPAQWFDNQRLDHFDGANKEVWSQRYFVNDTFYKDGGPIFVMIGGEGPASPVWMVEGTWMEYAQMYKAMAVQVEHRYYGESHPVKDLSIGNLRYLNSRQALADLANFIDFFRQKYNLPDNKLITFGGSYPGSLSAWFRSKYPYLVDGAVATSAPIFAKTDFLEYLNVVTDALNNVDPQCVSEIQKATKIMTSMYSQPEGRDMLYSMFNLCDRIDPTNMLDKANFFTNTAGNFEGVCQYNKDNRAFEGAIGTNITNTLLCSIMTDFTIGPAINRYAKVNSLLLKTYSQKCLDYKYDKMIDDMKKTDWKSEAGEGGRQWTYQTCAEFGWYQSSDYSEQPFGNFFPAKFSLKQCSDIYEANFSSLVEKNVEDTNRFYGGRNISVTKVVFPNGSVDPWHAMGVTSDISPDATAIYIPGTAHCANMYPATDSDPPELTAARKTIATLIAKWIA